MRYTLSMETRSTSVRIDEATRDRLKNLSDKSGVSITKLITLATSYYIEHAESEGMINVPLKYPAKETCPKLSTSAESRASYQVKGKETRKP